MKKLAVKQTGETVITCYLDGKEITVAKAVKFIKDNNLTTTPYTVQKWSAGIKQDAMFSSQPRSEKVYGTFAEAYQAATKQSTAANWQVIVKGKNGYYFNTSKIDCSTNKSREDLNFEGEEFIIGAEITALDDGSNDEPETDFLATLDTSIDEDNETEELIDAAENKVLIVADQFTALELVEDYYPNLIINGKLTKSNGVLTAINADGVQVAIHDDHLEVDNGNGIWRIDYDISETEFRRVLREVTLKMIEKGANCPTFEIVGKSGLIYTYTEATLKPLFTETQIEHDTRINSAPPQNLKIEVPANVNELWKILRQKQQALKAIMTEKSIAATRKYNVQFAEIKVIVNEINRLTQTAAA